MGSSYVYMDIPVPENLATIHMQGEWGFWVRDGQLEMWVKSLTEVITQSGNIPAWIGDLLEQWRLQEHVYGAGFVSLALHRFVREPERRELLFAYAKDTVERLVAADGNYFEAFPSTIPEFRCTCGRCVPRGPLTFSEKMGVIEIGFCFLRLLNGYQMLPNRSNYGYVPEAFAATETGR